MEEILLEAFEETVKNLRKRLYAANIIAEDLRLISEEIRRCVKKDG